MQEDAQVLKPLRIELALPANQGDRTWHLARQYMLGPHLYSFLFKLLHQILPTAERISRIMPNQSPNCTRCKKNEPETLTHALVTCDENQGVSLILLQGLRKVIPSLSPINMLTLDFETDEQHHFPLVWCTATFLSSLWHLRVEKKKVELIKIRSELEANCRLLRESRLSGTTNLLSQIL